MLGMRIAGRRPRRALLCVVSIATTVTAIVAVLIAHSRINQDAGPSTGLPNPATTRLDQILLIITVMLSLLAAVNAVFITWSTITDTRRSSAIARALGVTPNQRAAAISTAQVIPAFLGALLGVPAGILLVLVVSGIATTTYPPRWILGAVVPIATATVAAMTALPARRAARTPVAATLRTDLG